MLFSYLRSYLSRKDLLICRPVQEKFDAKDLNELFFTSCTSPRMGFTTCKIHEMKKNVTLYVRYVLIRIKNVSIYLYSTKFFNGKHLEIMESSNIVKESNMSSLMISSINLFILASNRNHWFESVLCIIIPNFLRLILQRYFTYLHFTLKSQNFIKSNYEAVFKYLLL